MLNEHKPLWVKVLKSKYKVLSNPRKWALKPSSSPIWRSIYSSKDIISKGIKCNVGNGKCIDVWRDKWVGNDTLLNRLDMTDYSDEKVSVQSLMINGAAWDIHKIRTMFPHDIVTDIENIPLPTTMNMEDKASWLGSGSGKFSMGKCYSHILDLNAIDSTRNLD